MGDRTPRVPADRRREERRLQQDRRSFDAAALLKELAPIRDALDEHRDRIKKLEDEQRVQLVRFSQIQREIDDLKKAQPQRSVAS